MPEHLSVPDLANIDIIKMRPLRHAVEGDLDEAAEIRRDLSRVIERHDIDDGIVVGPEAGRGTAFLRGRGMRERGPHRGGERQPVILSVVADIAVQFEVAPERLELRSEGPDVAGRARLAGLDREGRHRLGLPCGRGGQKEQNDQSAVARPLEQSKAPVVAQPNQRWRTPLQFSTWSTGVTKSERG